MFTKKFLSLLLAVGLAFGSTSSVFAGKGEYKSDTLLTVSEDKADIMINIDEVLKLPVCRDYLLSALSELSILSVVAFCCQLKYATDICRLKAEFERLYNDEPAFKEVVDKAWVIDVETGSKEHASIQCIDKHTAIPVRRLSRKYWVIDVETGRKKHASIQGIKKRKSGHYTQENYIDKHKSGKW
ncbi:MAG: hypothetical protein IJG00_03170 [Clostridia bacterium]|nr:hypothetical protein [Clostridia bacterium]